MMSSLTIGYQLLILFVIGGGNAHWLWRLTGTRRGLRPRDHLWFAIAGFCITPLLLQSFVYLGFPLRLTAWPSFALSAVGVSLALRRGAGRLIFSPELRLYVLIFAAAFLGQAFGLLATGPANYFGSGKYDHANYVVMADFFRDLPFDTRVEGIGYRPWITKVLALKEQRITQSVALGALAELTRSSAQAAYGTMSAFFVAMAGVATTGWLRSAGFSRVAAGWAGLAAALTPAFTRIQLDGFFSQTSTLFVYPALAGLLGGSRAISPIQKTISAILLAFFIGSYSEAAVFVVALVTGLVLGTGRPSWRTQAFDLAAILAGSLLLNPGYLQRLPQFLIGQAIFASNPETLAKLFPESGTWMGWGRMFFDVPQSGLAAILGLVIVGLGLWSVRASARRPQWKSWTIVLGVALMPVLVLRLAPNFHSYPFGKLTAHFIPIWIGAAMAGFSALFENRVYGRSIVGMGGAVFSAACLVTAWPQQRTIVHPSGWLAVLSSDTLQQTRREMAAHPGRAHLVTHRDPLVGLWLCYFGRKGPTVFENRILGDAIVPSEVYPFRRWSASVGPLWWLDPEWEGAVVNYETTPSLSIRSAAQVTATPTGKHYTLTDTLELVFTRPTEGLATRTVWLDFVATPIGAGAPVELILENPGYKNQRAVIEVAGWQRWLVPLPLGETICRFRVRRTGDPIDSNPALDLKLFSVEVAQEILSGDPQPTGIVETR